MVSSTSSLRCAPTYWDIKTVPPEAKPIIKNVKADTTSPPMPTGGGSAYPLNDQHVSSHVQILNQAGQEEGEAEEDQLFSYAALGETVSNLHEVKLLFL